MSDAILDSIKDFGVILGQATKEEQRKLRLSKISMLGARFSEEIMGAEDLQTLSDTMLRLNKIAFTAGVPELANQVNNLGRLKQLQITEAEQDLTATQQADFYKGAIRDQLVLVNGEYIPIGDTDEWKKVGELKPELQAGAYQELAKRFSTQLKSVISPLGDGSYGFRQYAYDQRGEQKLVRELAPSTGGTYQEVFDLMTPEKGFGTNIKELHQEPAELTAFKTEKALEDEEFRKRQKEFDRRVGVQTAAQLKRYGLKQDLKRTYATEDQLKDANKWETYRNKLEGNIKGSATDLRTQIFSFTSSGIGEDKKISKEVITNIAIKTDPEGSMNQILAKKYFQKGGEWEEILEKYSANELGPGDEQAVGQLYRAIEEFREEQKVLLFEKERRKDLVPEIDTDNTPNPLGPVKDKPIIEY